MKKLITGIFTLSAAAASLVPSAVSAVYFPAASSDVIQEQLENYTYSMDLSMLRRLIIEQ